MIEVTDDESLAILAPRISNIKLQNKKDSENELNVTCFSSSTYHYHGDDALGVLKNCMVVADGVTKTDLSSGVLANALAVRVLGEIALLSRGSSVHNPINLFNYRQAINSAIENAKIKTSKVGRLDSTLCAAYFDHPNRRLYTYTLGDSKCIVVRNGEVVYESVAIVYDFNLPVVISTSNDSDGMPFASVESFDYQSGDICLVFSDGIVDNLYLDEIFGVLEKYLRYGVNRIAKELNKLARKKMNGKDLQSTPFTDGALLTCQERAMELSNSDPKLAKKILDECKKRKTNDRPYLCKEKKIEQVNFYSIDNLLHFAEMKSGKADDISICIAKIP